MADDEIQVKFGASTGELLAGADEVKDAIGSIAGTVQQALGALSALSGAIAGAFAVNKIADFESHYAEVGEQIERTAAIIGVSTKQTQELGFISEVTGGSAQGMATAIERMQVNLQAAINPTSRQAQALAAMGLSARQLLDLPVDEQLNVMADAFKRLHDEGINPTSIGITLMGRGAAGMVPFLEQGRAGLDQLRNTADRVGAVMSKETVEALAANERASVTLRSAVSGLAGTIAGELAPALTKEENGLATLIGDISLAIQTHTLWNRVVIGLQTGLSELEQVFVNVGTVAKDVFTLNWGAIAQDRQDGLAKIAEIQQEGDDRINTLALDAQAKMQQILSGPNTDKPLKSPSFAVNTDGIKAAAEQAAEQQKLAQEQYTATVKLADTAFASTKEHLDAEVKLHQMTYSEETAALLQALDQRHTAEAQAQTAEVAAENAALEAKIALYARGTAEWQKAVDEQTEFLQKAYDQRRELDAKYFAERQQIVDRGAEEEGKQWKSVADQMAGAFNSQVPKILQGQETITKGLERASGQLIIKLIEDQIKLSAEWLIQNALRLASHLATEAGMTTATVTGAAARTAAQTASGQVSILETIANAMKAIFSSAGQTTAEVSAAVAPEAGPAAPAIGAAAGAAVVGAATSLASFDVGTDYVLKGGLAMIHRGEEIKPAQGSGPWTGGRDSGGLDARTIGSMLGAHREAMGNMVSSVRKSMSSFEHEVRLLRKAAAGAR